MTTPPIATTNPPTTTESEPSSNTTTFDDLYLYTEVKVVTIDKGLYAIHARLYYNMSIHVYMHAPLPNMFHDLSGT